MGGKYCQSKLAGLEITNFHSWFRNSLHYLFDHCRGECLHEIEHVMNTHILQDFSTFTGTNHIELLQKEKNSMIRRWIDLSWPEFETYFNLLMNVNQVQESTFLLKNLKLKTKKINSLIVSLQTVLI